MDMQLEHTLYMGVIWLAMYLTQYWSSLTMDQIIRGVNIYLVAEWSTQTFSCVNTICQKLYTTNM